MLQWTKFRKSSRTGNYVVVCVTIKLLYVSLLYHYITILLYVPQLYGCHVVKGVMCGETHCHMLICNVYTQCTLAFVPWWCERLTRLSITRRAKAANTELGNLGTDISDRHLPKQSLSWNRFSLAVTCASLLAGPGCCLLSPVIFVS
jgi:hypothetical protein